MNRRNFFKVIAGAGLIPFLPKKKGLTTEKIRETKKTIEPHCVPVVSDEDGDWQWVWISLPANFVCEHPRRTAYIQVNGQVCAYTNRLVQERKKWE